jgi:putative membrane protein
MSTFSRKILLVLYFKCRLSLLAPKYQPQTAASCPGSLWEPAMLLIGRSPLRERSNAMTESAAPHGTTRTLPPRSANGSAPAAPAAPPRRRLSTQISSIRTGLIASVAALIVVLIFIIQNAHTVNISFLGVHLQLPLAVAMLLAVIAGALLMAAAGTARIAQLRRLLRRAAGTAPASDRTWILRSREAPQRRSGRRQS